MYNVIVWVIVCYVGFVVVGKIFFLQKLGRGTLWVSFLVGEGVPEGAYFRTGEGEFFSFCYIKFFEVLKKNLKKDIDRADFIVPNERLSP